MSDVNRHALTPASLALAAALRDLLVLDFALGAEPRTVVAIAGESGSGKSLTAASLAHLLTAGGLPALVLHQDDYFRLPPRANHEARVADVGQVGPQEVDLDALAAQVEAFRAGRDGVPAPLVDYAADAFRTQRHDYGEVRVLVVEGTYALQVPGADVRVFLDATFDDTRGRRRERARDLDSPFVEQVLAIEHARILPQARIADVLIDRDFRVRRAADAAAEG